MARSALTYLQPAPLSRPPYTINPFVFTLFTVCYDTAATATAALLGDSRGRQPVCECALLYV